MAQIWPGSCFEWQTKQDVDCVIHLEVDEYSGFAACHVGLIRETTRSFEHLLTSNTRNYKQKTKPVLTIFVISFYDA